MEDRQLCMTSYVDIADRKVKHLKMKEVKIDLSKRRRYALMKEKKVKWVILIHPTKNMEARCKCTITFRTRFLLARKASMASQQEKEKALERYKRIWYFIQKGKHLHGK